MLAKGGLQDADLSNVREGVEQSGAGEVEAPDTLAKAIRAVARIGGYLYRPRGPRPAPRSSGGAMQPSRECASDTLWQWKGDHDKNQQDGKPGIICGARVALGSIWDYRKIV